MSTPAARHDPSREGEDDSPARAAARLRTGLYITQLRGLAGSWPGWSTMPASRRHVLYALLAEAESRGFCEFECSERYLVAVFIRHRHTVAAVNDGRWPSPISAATCHRVLVDLCQAGWIELSREGCKTTQHPRRWRLTRPPDLKVDGVGDGSHSGGRQRLAGSSVGKRLPTSQGNTPVPGAMEQRLPA